MDKLVKQIAGDPVLRKIASAATKQVVDSIFGYPKYDVEEVSSELRERLYNPRVPGSLGECDHLRRNGE